MKVVYTAEGLVAAKSQVARFLKLYEQAFPDENEREDFQLITDRIETKQFTDDPKTFLVLVRNAGMVVEYYHSCRCILITYIVVAERYRKKGLARELLTEGLSNVRQLIEKGAGTPVKGIFFEVNNPLMTKAEDDSMQPWQRLAFFRKMGAKLIDIPYVQPSLGTDKGRVSNLHLCCFPVAAGRDVIPTDTILAFLDSFYKELGTEAPQSDEDFRTMKDSLMRQDEDGKYYLKEIPRLQTDRLSFDQCALAFHIANHKAGEACDYCAYFGSFERDLFSGRYQHQTPYQSICLNPYEPFKLNIHFPAKVEYSSEGRMETLCTMPERQQVEARVYISITNFYEADKSVLNLVFQPAEGSTFTEWDLVKLSSVFGSNQEQSNLRSEVRFALNGGEYVDMEGLVNSLFKGSVEVAPRLDEVTTSLEIAQVQGESLDWKGYLQSLHEMGSSQRDSYKPFLQQYESGELTGYLSNALCGMTLGIFDFERMGGEETLDTLKPVQSYPTSCMIMNRSNILMLTQDDSVFESSYGTIGISPYLIIPNVVLNYNRLLLKSCFSRLSSLLQKPQHLAESERILSEVETDMTHQLRQVFQYPTEKKLLEAGKEEHDLFDLQVQIEELQKDLSHRIDRGYHKHRNYFDLLITFLLMVISLLQIEPLIRLVAGFVSQKTDMTAVDTGILVFYVLSYGILGVLIYRYGRRAYKSR